MKRHKALITLSSDHQNGLAVSNKLKYTYKPTSSELPPPSPEHLKEIEKQITDNLQLPFLRTRYSVRS